MSSTRIYIANIIPHLLASFYIPNVSYGSLKISMIFQIGISPLPIIQFTWIHHLIILLAFFLKALKYIFFTIEAGTKQKKNGIVGWKGLRCHYQMAPQCFSNFATEAVPKQIILFAFINLVLVEKYPSGFQGLNRRTTSRPHFLKKKNWTALLMGLNFIKVVTSVLIFACGQRVVILKRPFFHGYKL